MASQSSEQIEKVSIKEEADEVYTDNVQLPHLQFDSGDEYSRFRQKWWQLWLPKDPPPPAPASLEDAELTPLANASIFAQLTYTWVTDIMVLGFQRTLQASDLYKMDPSRESGVLAAQLEAAWQRRVQAAADWNARLESGELSPSLLKRASWALRAISSKGETQATSWSERFAAFQNRWRESEGQKQASLTWALNDVFGNMFWIGGAFKVVGDTALLMGPIILRQIIYFAEERAATRSIGEPVPNIGRGIGMAFGLWVLNMTASICSHQFFWRSMTTGILARAALITCIYDRGVNLTGKARVKLSNSTLVNHISTDVSRIDACAQWFHGAWAAPIQATICLIILLIDLGPSALAGFLLFILIIPFQGWLMTLQHRIRLDSMKWTEQRAKVLLEALASMRVVKYFSYEVLFLQRIFELRKKELHGIRRILHSSSASLALIASLPLLASHSRKIDIGKLLRLLVYFQISSIQVNIARALYYDPLSAVDAHVGKSLFQGAIGGLRNRSITVIFVTHAIHFLSQVDYIYTVNDGTITESGTYDELISRGGEFARLDLEFGGHASEGKDNDRIEEVIAPQRGITIEDAKLQSENAREKATGSGKLEGRLIVKEKRSTGSVSWRGAIKSIS